MNEMTRSSPLDIGRISKADLTRSLLGEALRTDRISENEADRIRLDILALLSERIWEYTSHKSYSVRQETAENIFESLLFTLDTRLDEYSPEDALQLLETASIKQLFDAGLEKIKTALEEAKIAHSNLIAVPLTGILALQDTAKKAIPMFFSAYDPEFAAHEIPAGIDYPLLADIRDRKGVFYIKLYIERLLCEEEFCSCFEPALLRKILRQVGQQYGDDYRLMLMNAAQIALNGAVGAVMAHKSALHPLLTAAECALLQQSLSVLPPDGFLKLTRQVLQSALAELEVTDPEALQYLSSYAGALAPALKNAIELDTLPQLLPTETAPRTPELQFDDGPPMADRQFRWVANHVLTCPSAEKAAFIRSHVSSLQDLADIFESNCLFGDEFELVFSLLEDIELSVLLSRFFDLPAALSLADDPESWDFDRSKKWLCDFQQFIAKMNPDSIRGIVHVAKQLSTH